MKTFDQFLSEEMTPLQKAVAMERVRLIQSRQKKKSKDRERAGYKPDPVFAKKPVAESHPDDELVSVGTKWNGGDGKKEKMYTIPKPPASLKVKKPKIEEDVEIIDESSAKILTPQGYKRVGVRAFKAAESKHYADIDQSTRNHYGIVSHSKRGMFVAAKHYSHSDGVHSTETYSHARHNIPGVIHKHHSASDTSAYFVKDQQP